VTPDQGDAFWAYGRSQSLTKLDEPKLIVRVLSLAPQYMLDTDGLVTPGGGDGGPYYLVRPEPSCPEHVKLGETVSYADLMSASGVGWLIQATVGSFGGVGRWCRNLAGLAA
jgi:hypothetical protein